MQVSLASNGGGAPCLRGFGFCWTQMRLGILSVALHSLPSGEGGPPLREGDTPDVLRLRDCTNERFAAKGEVIAGPRCPNKAKSTTTRVQRKMIYYNFLARWRAPP